MRYVAYDYEIPGEPENYWHIYTTDAGKGSLNNGGSEILTIKAPETEEMRAAIQKICEAIDAAVEIAERHL